MEIIEVQLMSVIQNFDLLDLDSNHTHLWLDSKL
jgi:hypothetical protein